jgi:hypothetical protein
MQTLADRISWPNLSPQYVNLLIKYCTEKRKVKDLDSFMYLIRTMSNCVEIDWKFMGDPTKCVVRLYTWNTRREFVIFNYKVIIIKFKNYYLIL